MSTGATPRWEKGTAPVAVVMISLNEAHNLEDVLANLQGWAEEVFLVDSYSADKTIDIALSRGIHVVQRKFPGFGDQWNFALSALPITARWTMKLDPDERLTDELKSSISASIARDAVDGISVIRRLFFMGRPLPIRQEILRLWRTGACRFSDVLVNEHPIIEGAVETVVGDLDHHDSPNLHHWVSKQNNYSTAEALTAFRGDPLAAPPSLRGSPLARRMWLKKNFYHIPFRFTLLFLWNYFVLGAYRAGWPGFAWARSRSDVYRSIEYKVKEMRLRGKALYPSVTQVGTPDPRVEQY